MKVSQDIVDQVYSSVLTVVLLLAGALSAALLGAVRSELGRVGSDRALVLHLSREAG